MSKKCFVVMPYGSTEEAKKEYGKVYKFLIKAAAEEAGLECFRSDLEGKGGHILSNVIDDIADSDIVIADISGFNWNVAYELGMRHALCKNGTIMICNSSFKDDLPFDIRALDITFYPPDWIDDDEAHCAALKKAIESRINGKTKNDSPVHEKYSYLPANIIHGFSEKTDDSLKKANEKIAELEKELLETRSKIEAMGISLSDDSSSDENIDYSKVFLAELANSIYNSDEAVAKLRELHDKKDNEEFVKFLGKVLTVGFLDETDCRSVYFLCSDLEVPAITRKYLEAVTKFYPENEDLSGYLANEYSKNYHTGEKAIQIVNGIIGVSKKDGKFLLSKTTQVTSSKLASFFDVYLHLKKYREIVEISLLLIERFADNVKILNRVYANIINAYIRLEDLDNARIYKEKFVDIANESDYTHYIFARYENAAGNYANVVEEVEMSIALDSRDIDYYYNMAGYICDNMYARDPDTLEIVKISYKEVAMYTVPFIIEALKVDRSAYKRAFDFLRRHKLGEYIEPIYDALKQSKPNLREVFPELNYGAVDYCIEKQK